MQQTSPIIIYQTDDGQMQIDVRMENETVWLSQQQMAELFQKDQSVIARHIRNVFSEGELVEQSNMQILHNTLSKYKPTKVYNLDVIISVGYRVKSKRGTQFRIWANKVLKDYLIKGYAVNNKLSQQKFDDLSKLVNVLGRTIKTQEKLTSLYNPDGTKRIADNTLVALTLMIAESRTEEKDTMVKVVVNLINQNNV